MRRVFAVKETTTDNQLKYENYKEQLINEH